MLNAHYSLTVMFGVKRLEIINKNSMSKQNKTKQNKTVVITIQHYGKMNGTLG
jgi:hypothetical protein